MTLPLYLVGSFLVAILGMAFMSRGPEDMIVSAFVVWVIPASFASALRKKPTWLSRYGWPTLTLIVMLFLMYMGTAS